MVWKSLVLFNGRFLFMVIALFIFICISCAKQGFPPGGATDETAPELISSIPVVNSTNVSTNVQLVFEFSEPMDEESVEKNLFIVPIPVLWPEFEWRSRSKILVFKPTQPLNDNTTYVVSIGADARDLRRNGLGKSIVLCFSTGDILENKIIRGHVIPYNYFSEKIEKVSAVDVIAYQLEDPLVMPDPRNIVPDYFTQTSMDGSYEIAGLSSGLYRIFAIGDNDKDGFYTEGYDLIGVMSHDLGFTESDSVLIAPDISVSSKYTTEMQLISIKVPDRQRIELFFDRVVNPDSIQIEIEGLNVLGLFLNRKNPETLSVATEVQESGRRYIIKNMNVTDIYSNRLMSFESQPYFTGTDRPDTTALEIEEQTPKILSSPDEHINIFFNRVLDFPRGIEGIIEEDSGKAISVVRTVANGLELAPVDSWKNGFNYIILFDRESLRGVAGNRLTDLGSQLTFRVVPSDTLGYLEGSIEDKTENPALFYRLILKNINTDTVKNIIIHGTGEWISEPVLPGRYVCIAHKDDNRDGEIFRGTVFPYSPAEQVAVYPDTVQVEPRWTVKDIDFIFR